MYSTVQNRFTPYNLDMMGSISGVPVPPWYGLVGACARRALELRPGDGVLYINRQP